MKKTDLRRMSWTNGIFVWMSCELVFSGSSNLQWFLLPTPHSATLRCPCFVWQKEKLLCLALCSSCHLSQKDKRWCLPTRYWDSVCYSESGSETKGVIMSQELHHPWASLIKNRSMNSIHRRKFPMMHY